MICKNCGYEFEGIFCPECGTKSDNVNIDKDNTTPKAEEISKLTTEVQRVVEENARQEVRLKEVERINKEKAESERIAREKAEKKLKEKAESERLAREKAEKELKDRMETEILYKEKMNLDLRTFNGVVYSDEEEAVKAREENNIIDSLKQKLKTTKSQEQRRTIMAEFDFTISTSEAKKRLELLKIKVSQDKPKSIMINWIYGGTVLLSAIIVTVIESMSQMDSPLIYILLCWYGFGVPIWIIWKIVLTVKKHQKSYYLNIDKI